MGGQGRFCRKCGRELRPGARFCAACGEITSAGSQTATQAGADIDRSGESEAATDVSGIADRDTLYEPRPNVDAAHPPDIGRIDALPDRESAGDAHFPRGDEQPRPAWPGRPLTVGLVVLVAAGLATAALFILHPFGHHPAPRAASTVAPAATRTAPASASAPSFSSPPTSPEQAAQNLATLLAHSVNDRSSIDGAYNDALDCGPGLDQDAQTFRAAARSREQLLSQLANMPSRAALSGQMLGDLTGAWKASAQADNDYAKWVQDLVSAGCVPGNQSDPHFVAARNPNTQATADKKAFARQWNPLAAQYGLTSYRQGEL